MAFMRMLDDITHSNQDRKKRFLCQILLKVLLKYRSDRNVYELDQCSISIIFVFAGECGGIKAKETHKTVIILISVVRINNCIV